MALINPGKPWQNGIAESFNGKDRGECLWMKCFRIRTEAKVVTKQWRQHYYEVRPHSSLGNQTPAAFKRQQCISTTQRPFSRNEWSDETKQVTVMSLLGQDIRRS